jgi:hypothetical protein
MNKYARHVDRNAAWIAAGGAGHTVPAPQPPQTPKTPFELSCDNDCKITHTDECCICLEMLGKKNKVITPCGHQFHYGCLIQDANRSDKCPMCRAVIRPEMPKRSLDLPSEDFLLRLASSSAIPIMGVLDDLGTVQPHQRTFVIEAFAQIMAESSMMVINAVRRRNE